MERNKNVTTPRFLNGVDILPSSFVRIAVYCATVPAQITGSYPKLEFLPAAA
jgi:hypothetical protein